MKYLVTTDCSLDGRALARGEVVDLPDPVSWQASRCVLWGGLVPHRPAPPPPPEVAGALAERQRIEKITALALPGYEAVARHAITETMTPGQFAVAQVEAQQRRRSTTLAALRADEAALDPISPMVSGDIGGANEEAAVADGIVALHRRLSGQDR